MNKASKQAPFRWSEKRICSNVTTSIKEGKGASPSVKQHQLGTGIMHRIKWSGKETTQRQRDHVHVHQVGSVEKRSAIDRVCARERNEVRAGKKKKRGRTPTLPFSCGFTFHFGIRFLFFSLSLFAASSFLFFFLFFFFFFFVLFLIFTFLTTTLPLLSLP